MIDQITVQAAVADARRAAMEFDGAQVWLCARPTLTEPLAAEVWATDPSYTHVLLVRHRVRGWVPPGGTVEAGETPRADWAPTLSLSYGAIIGRDVPLGGESGQPSRWVDLDEMWESVFPEDRDRIRAHVRRLAWEHSVGVR